MENNTIKIDKILRKEDCEKGRAIVSQYDETALAYREACVMCCEQSDLLIAIHTQIVKKDAKALEAYMTGKKVEDDETKQMLRSFEQVSIQKVGSEKARIGLLSNLNSLRKQRVEYMQKMFKRYSLNKAKTYRFEFNTQEIFEEVPKEAPKAPVLEPSKELN